MLRARDRHLADSGFGHDKPHPPADDILLRNLDEDGLEALGLIGFLQRTARLLDIVERLVRSKIGIDRPLDLGIGEGRSEEHTSELQSLMRISYAVFCLKKKNKKKVTIENHI